MNGMKKKKILMGILILAVLFSSVPVSAQNGSGGEYGTQKSGTNSEEYLDLTIKYFIEGTLTPIAESYKASLLPGSDYSVESPIIKGYQLSEESSQTVSGILSEDTEITVFYKAAGEKAYTIRYVGLDIDGTEKEVLDSISGTGTVGEIITAEEKSFPGYIREPGAMTLVITADGQASLDVEYVQITDPCIIFNTGGDYVEPIVAPAGTDISLEADNREDTVPVRQGYIFAGWDQEIPDTMPDNDMVITAEWTPGTSEYIVEYYFQDTEGDGYTRNDGMDEVRVAATESTVTASDDDKQKGISIGTGSEEDFYGFDYSHCEDVQVTADGQAVLKLYFDREIWTVNLHSTPMRGSTTKAEYENISKQENDILESYEGRYGSAFPENYPTTDELKEKYGSLCPADWEGYSYVNMLWPAQSEWGSSGISKAHFLQNRTFELEDTAGSREVNLYPFYATGSNTLYIDYYTQNLNDPSAYTLVRERTEIVPYQDATFNVLNDMEGFTIMGGSYRSKKITDEWPAGESGETLYPNNKNWPTGYWTPVTEWHDQGANTAKLPTKILTDTELRFQRLKYSLSFYSDNEPIKTETDIYYETPLASYLEYQPSEELADGRTFLGWCGSYDDKEPVDTNMTMPANDVVLYALWGEPEYTVTFDSMGGTEVTAQNGIQKGEHAVKPEDPQKTGHTFVGWYYEKDDGSWERWSFDQEITKDIRLYAVWRPEGTAAYKIKHIMEGAEEPFYTVTGSGKPGDTITAGALGENDKHYPEGNYFRPDAYTRSIRLTETGPNEIIFIYSESQLKDYVVHYYLEGTTQSLAPDKNVTDTEYSIVTEKAKDITGYTIVEEDDLIAAPGDSQGSRLYKEVRLKTGETNEIIFYYAAQGSVIAPAPVTIYMGGDGYEGTATEEGTLASANGFPEPGFFIYPPEGVDTDSFDPTEAVLQYKNGNDIRRWSIVSYDGTEGKHNIYRFVPEGETDKTAVRMQFVKEDGTTVTDDEFIITDHLDQDLTMEVYGDSIDAGYVTLEYQGESYQISAGTGMLRVRSTTSQVAYGEIVSSDSQIQEGQPGVLAASDTVYYINDSAVKVEEPSGVKLLFDHIVENNNNTSGKTNTELLEERTQEEIQKLQGTEGFQLSAQYPLKYECRYLDLVDNHNGNTWVSADNTDGYVTVYWPLPEGTDRDTKFELFHYQGLHREMGVDEVEGQIDACEPEHVSIEVTDTHITFRIPRAGFSPFVLAWENTAWGNLLPHVGGEGAVPAAAAGSVLIAAGCLGLRRRRRKI